MGINRKNKTTTFEKYRVDNSKNELGHIKEDVIKEYKKKTNKTEENNFTNITT